MKKVKVITDSCSDLTPELLKKYDIDYAKMNLIYDGKEYIANLDWKEISPKQLYDGMRGKVAVKSTQVPTTEFERIFKEYLDKDFDIVYVGCSTKQSGSVNTGAVVASNMLKDYPDSKIYCIDPDNASLGEGILAIYCAELAKEGKGADEIRDAVLSVKNNVREYIAVNTLEYLRRAGRVKGSKAFFGNLMGIKPIIIADANGVQTPVKKVKGRKNSLDEIVSMLKDTISEPEKQTVYIIHADANEEDVKYLQNKVKEEIPCKDIYTTYIGPIIGASLGPDAIGVFAFGKKVEYEFKG